jgi:hypothetical protein
LRGQVIPRRRGASKINGVIEFYCVCRKPYTGEFMIRCDECKEWYMYHGKCVKVTQEEEEAEAMGDFV